MCVLRRIILHDYFESAEGGGKLSLILAKAFEADLGYGFKTENHPYFEGGLSSVGEHDLECYSRIPVWRQLRLARAFQKRTNFLDSYEVAIYSGFYAPLAVFNHGGQRNFYYCHTPPRFIYDQRHFYLSMIPFWQRPILLGLISYIKPRYEKAVAQMDMIIANSENVRQRLSRYLGCKAIVVYPPCETEHFRWQGQGDFYLSTARLDSLKRVDLIVKAFIKMPDKKLVVTSGGLELDRLKRLARDASNITFTGWVGEGELQRLVGNSIATIYVPKEEDFGMSPVESMAAGKPVIGVAEGGLLETVVDGETGFLLRPDPRKEDIIGAIRRMDGSMALEMRGACEERAQQFDAKIFIEKMREVMEKKGDL